MSEKYITQWLINLFSSPNLQVDKTREHIGRAVQLLFIQNKTDTHPELKYPVTCEVSDGKHYIRGVLTKKSVKRLEKASNRHIESLSGVTVVIQSCVPKAFIPGVTHCQSVPCKVAAKQEPAFWMVITKLRYVGGAGNGVFGEPRYITSNAYVRRRLGEHIEMATPFGGNDVTPHQQLQHTNEVIAIEVNECEVHDQISCQQYTADGQNSGHDNGNTRAVDDRERLHSEVIEPNEVEIVAPMLKRQRVDTGNETLLTADVNEAMEILDLHLPGLDVSQNEGQSEGQRAGQNQGQVESLALPILANQPIRFTADAAWECQEMWYALSVQQACLPLMKMSTPEQPHITSDCVPSSSTRQLTAAAYASNNEHCMPRSTLAETSGNIDGNTVNAIIAEPRVRQPLTETIINRPISDNIQGALRLDRLMRPEGYGCVESSTAMDLLFGNLPSSPPCSTGVDIPAFGISERIEYNPDSAMHWNQPDRITLCEVSPTGEN